MADLLEWAEACKRMEAGDFNFDATLTQHFAKVPDAAYFSGSRFHWGEEIDGVVHGKIAEVIAYTRSMEGAATLIPAGLEWAVGNEEGGCFATVHKPDVYSELVEAATPALSLCAAALLAIIAEEETRQ